MAWKAGRKEGRKIHLANEVDAVEGDGLALLQEVGVIPGKGVGGADSGVGTGARTPTQLRETPKFLGADRLQQYPLQGRQGGRGGQNQSQGDIGRALVRDGIAPGRRQDQSGAATRRHARNMGVIVVIGSSVCSRHRSGGTHESKTVLRN